MNTRKGTIPKQTPQILKQPLAVTPGSIQAQSHNSPDRPLSTMTPTLKKTPVVLNKIPPQDDDDATIAELKKELEQIEKNISQCDTACIQMRQKQKQFDSVQLQQAPIIAEKDQQISRLKGEIDNVKTELQEQVGECRDMLQQIKDSGLNKQKFDEVEENLTESEKCLKELTAQVEKQKQENELQEKQLTSANRAYEELRLRADECLNDYQRLEDDLREEILKNEELTDLQRQYSQELDAIDREEQKLQKQLHEIITSPEYCVKQQQEQQRQNDQFDQKLEHEILKRQLFYIEEDIAVQEDKNRRLMQDVVEYGQSQGFDVDCQDLTFDQYLDQLQLYLKSQNRPKSSPLKKDDFDTEKEHLEQIVHSMHADKLFKVRKVNGQYQIQLLVDPRKLNYSELLELFACIDQLGDKLKIPMPQQKNDSYDVEDEDSSIYEKSEHDTMDPPSEELDIFDY